MTLEEPISKKTLFAVDRVVKLDDSTVCQTINMIQQAVPDMDCGISKGILIEMETTAHRVLKELKCHGTLIDGDMAICMNDYFKNNAGREKGIISV